MLPALGFGAFVLFVLFPKQTNAGLVTAAGTIKNMGAAFGPVIGMGTGIWNAASVKLTAAKLRMLHDLNADPMMVAAMVSIESRYNPGAKRYEAHLNDSSYGLMQTMLKTAQWLHGLGYKGKDYPTAKTLVDGETSLYFGMAYIDYLAKYKGKARDERWIVESYNGGPGNSNKQTQTHYAKYLQAKTRVA